VPRGAALFEPEEVGSPQSLAEAITEQYGGSTWVAPADARVIRDVIYTRVN
jgi:hypothetical protein